MRRLPFTLYKLLNNKFALQLWLAVFLAVPWCTALAADYDVMLDASGSMAGFNSDSKKYSPSAWRQLLQTLEDGARDKYQFGDREKFGRVETPLTQVTLNHENTFLADAVQQWLQQTRSTSLVIITDNVADAGGLSGAQQDAFEKLLKGDDSPLSHISLTVLSLAFDGRIYEPDKKTGTPYRGPRAFLVYLLSTRGIGDMAFADLQRQLNDKLSGLQKSPTIRVKPALAMQSARLDEDRIKTSASQGVKVAIQNGILKIQGYRLGNPLNLKLALPVETDSDFKLTDVKLQSGIQFDEEKHLTKHDKITANVNPKTATLERGKTTSFEVALDIKPFGFNDVDFKQQLAFAMKGGTTITGELAVNYQAGQGSYKLSDDLLRQWNNPGVSQELDEPRESIQNRIFHLDKMVAGLLRVDATSQPLRTMRVELELRYPIGLLFSSLILGLFAISLLVWGLRHAQHQNYVVVDEDANELPISPRLGQRVYSYYQPATQDLWFSLRYLGFGFWISTPRSKQLRGSHWLTVGGRFSVHDPETFDERSWNLQKATTTSSQEEFARWDN